MQHQTHINAKRSQPSGAALLAKLRELSGRQLRVCFLVAFGWGVITLTSVLAAVTWLDLLFDLAPTLRAATPYFAVTAGLVLIGGLVYWQKQRFTPQIIARLLDSTASAKGTVLSGWSLLEEGRGATSETTEGLTQKAIADAANLAKQVSAATAIPLRPASRPWLGVLGIAVAAGAILLAAPQWAQTEWNRFAHPWNDTPPVSSTQLALSPGDTDVRWGDPLNVFVEVQGTPVDNVELVLTYDSGAEEIVPMFQEAGGQWRTVLSHLTESTDYHARAFHARSHRHRINILTVPPISRVSVEVIPPEYAQGIGHYSGPLPASGIAGLVGTQVVLQAESSRPLEGGEINWITSDQSTSFEMVPVPGETSQVQGKFVFETAGKFELRVRDIEGQASRDVVAGTVTIKPDHRPFIRLTRPQANSLATPGAYLPIEIAAEDDYGLSKIELFRSLNDSRALPLEMQIGQPLPRRQYDSSTLPLAAYGLQPGDQIKLFARCEDNDPSGAKGAETPVAIVHIISQEEFERMHRAREGLNVLMSKYRQAQRMLDKLREETKQLQEELQKQKGLVSKKDRDKAQELAKQIRKNIDALTKAAQHQLPYQTDKELSKHLENLAAQLEKAADQLERQLQRLEGQPDQQPKLDAELAGLLGMLGQQSDLFDEAAMVPLQRLEQVMPLMIAQARFQQLVKAQRDLANRLASLKGHDNEDNPALKARFRDLQEEQKRLRKELESLIEDIKDAALQLPEEDELNPLRDSAQKFAAAIEESGAAKEMDLADQGLAEFSGSKGHEHAELAAQALEKLLSESQSMQGQGQASLVFRPSISSLGQTAGQILSEMGLGQGSGNGFSSFRNGNSGLYGNLPGMMSMEGGLAGGKSPGGTGRGDTEGQGIGGENPDQDSVADLLTPGKAGGSGMTLIPLRYRERVGQYFRRLSTEIQKTDAYLEDER
ncbi:hypothetical protein GC197_16300 [bacterium]|nr:hypothetical protein [bacterium]